MPNEPTPAPWTMTEDGQFVMNEPYKTQVLECRLAATSAWREAIYACLVERTPYTRAQLNTELLRRNEKGVQGPHDLVDSCVIEALAGEL